MPVLPEDAGSDTDSLHSRLSPGMVEVFAGRASDVTDALEEAIQMVSRAATGHKTGIMVTQTGTGNYVVRAHPLVPVGFVRRR